VSKDVIAIVVRLNRDIELQKIQIFSDYFETRFNFLFSILAAIFPSSIIAALGFYYAGFLDLVGYILAITIVSLISLYGMSYLSRKHDELLEIIDEMFEQVEKGEGLPSLGEIRKMMKK